MSSTDESDDPAFAAAQDSVDPAQPTAAQSATQDDAVKNPESSASTGGAGRRLVFSILFVIVSLLLLEGFSSFVLAIATARRVEHVGEEAHCDYDADLGWSHIPSKRRENIYGEGRTLTVNAQGFRAAVEYAETVPEGTYRTICLGDSFTLGYGVDDAETYAAQLAALSGVETVNMGQGGYGVDQCYLWYKRDGVKIDCDLLLFAFIAPDFARMNSPQFLGFQKPFLRVENDELVIGNVPVPDTYSDRTSSQRTARFVQSLGISRLAAKALKRVGPDAASAADPLAFDHDVARAIFDDLARLSKERGQDFALVYLPLNRLIHTEPNQVTKFVREYAAESGVTLIELTDAFADVPASEFPSLSQPDNHYTAKGNRVIAEALLRQLRARFPKFPR